MRKAGKQEGRCEVFPAFPRSLFLAVLLNCFHATAGLAAGFVRIVPVRAATGIVRVRRICRKSKFMLALSRVADIYFLHLRWMDVLRSVAGGYMASMVLAELDFIEELRLRRWAREHYVPADERKRSWHPIILEEMLRKDEEVEPEEILAAHAR